MYIKLWFDVERFAFCTSMNSVLGRWILNLLLNPHIVS